MKIYSNRIYKSSQHNYGGGGISLGTGENLEIYDNYIEDTVNPECEWWSLAGIHTFNVGHSKFYNNKIINSSLGIHLDDDDGAVAHYNELYNNIIYNSMSGLFIEQEEDNTKIYNNTLVNNGWADLYFGGGHAYLTNSCIVKNNICYSDSRALYANNHVLEVTNLGTDNVFNNNLYYLQPGVSTGTFIEWPPTLEVYGNGVGTKYSMSQFSNYQSASQQDLNSLNSDPLFTDPANGDFTPLPDSPACHMSDTGSYVGAIPCIDSQICQTGDVNCDGSINISDVQQAVNLLLNNNYNSQADLNNDNVINIQDIQKIINIVLGTI